MWTSSRRLIAGGRKRHDLQLASHVVAASRKPKPQKPKRRKPKQPPMDQRIFMDVDLLDDEDEYEEELQPQPIRGLTSSVPSAPPPASRPTPLRPEDLYPVYAKPASAVTRVPRSRSGTGSWSWDEGDAQAQPVVPEWNPKTGFMRTRAQVSSAEGAPSTSNSSNDSRSSSSSSSSNATTSAPQQQQGTSVPGSSSVVGTDGTQSLAAVSRGQVLKSCIGLSAGMTVAAILLRAYAQQNATAALGTDPQVLATLLAVPQGLGGGGRDAAVLLAAAGTVTAARAVLLGTWGAFREATERSNQQVLGPLGWPDVVLVALLSGGSEELLFRGALIPASFPDWRGVLLSGALFGVLHNSGGRNAAFAAWATAVGCLYGGAYIYTGNVLVPAGAHALANFASAAMWLTTSNRSIAANVADNSDGEPM